MTEPRKPLFTDIELEELIHECESNPVVASNSAWSLLESVKDLRTRVAELEKCKEMLAVCEAAMELFNEGFCKKYHPGNDWFPIALVIPKALAKIEEMKAKSI